MAPGSWGALVAVPFGVVFGALPWPWRVAGCVLLAALATWAVSRYLGSSTHQDPQEVVLDEFVGCLITLCWIPVEWVWLAAGYGLFRLFDIWKPGPIGYVDTRWTAPWADQRSAHEQATPLKRVADPEELAEVTLFLLAGPGSGFITGQTIVVDGGKTLTSVGGRESWKPQPAERQKAT